MTTLKDLSPAEKKKLLQELEAEQRKEKATRKKKYDAYKTDVSGTVSELFPMLQAVSKELTKAKQMVYNKTQKLLNKKKELYESSVDNYTHTFTNEDGSISISIGNRVVDGWDDTVNAGIEKVKKYINKVSKSVNEDDRIRFLIETVNKLLSKDAQGNLKASRVLELKKVAENIKNKELQEGIEIIQAAYKPKRTKNFVSVVYKDKEGNELSLPLSITDAVIDLN